MKSEVEVAVEAWSNAPAHVKVVGGAYVSPMIAALVAIEKRVEVLEKEVKNGSK